MHPRAMVSIPQRPGTGGPGVVPDPTTTYWAAITSIRPNLFSLSLTPIYFSIDSEVRE